MSHLTRYPNQFYQPTPPSGTTPMPEAGQDPEELPFAEHSVSPTPSAPPLEPRRELTATPVHADGVAVLGLDHWSQIHGTH